MAQEAEVQDAEVDIARVRTYGGTMLLRYRTKKNWSKERQVKLEVSATVAIDETGAPIRAYAAVYDLGVRCEFEIDPTYRSIRQRFVFNENPAMLLFGTVLLFEDTLEFGFKLVAEDQEVSGRTRRGRIVGHGTVTMTEDLTNDPTEEKQAN